MSTARRSEAIWIDKKGYWQIKVQKNGERKAFTSSIKGRKGKHAAEAKADDWLEKGTLDMRFDSAWCEFINDQQQRTSEASWKKHEQYANNYILPNVGKRKLSTITPVMWQSCIDSAAKKGLSRRSCSNVRATITAFVKYALRARWDIQRLEDGDLAIPRAAMPGKGKKVLQPDALRKLFEDPSLILYGKPRIVQYSYAWQFLAATGLRRGELCGLKAEDLEGSILHVRRSINSTRQVTSGKNDNARRTIELSNTALAVLDRQREMLRLNGIKSAWLFPDKYGECANPNHIYDQWKSWCKQNDVDLSLHELRHTFISINRADLPLELIKSVVGHSSSMDTFAVYGHEVEGDRHRAACIIDSVFTRILEPHSESAEKVGGKVGG